MSTSRLNFRRSDEDLHLLDSKRNLTLQPNNQAKSASLSSHANPNRFYATALNGNSSVNYVPKDKTILKFVTLNETDLIDTSDMRNVILAKYIGGMWLWIEFDSPEACQKLQSIKDMSWYFTLLKHITQSFVIDERVVWIEIGGLPLNAWTSKAFKKIACSWGVPLFVDEDPSENAVIGRVCIKTKIQGQINETCKVVIHGKSHNVFVKEFAG
ncbi:RNA-directed DNA polymerase, eukaryota [Tanacetum coccineum]